MERIHSSSAKAKKSQRRQIKAQRRAIHPFKRMRASHCAANILCSSLLLRRAKRIGSYLDVQGEFPTAAINDVLIKRGKALYFPSIHDFRNGGMHFVQWTKSSRLKVNKFNIPEIFPDTPTPFSNELDLVLLPLLGFDVSGNRLGMGGGFYDRYLTSYSTRKRPFALGVAYNIQRLGQIKAEQWDYPLDAILTESGIQHFRR